MKVLFVTDLIQISADEICAKALIPIIKELELEGAAVDIIRPNFLLNSFIRGKKIKPNGTYECNGLSIKNINFFLPFVWVPKIDISQYDRIIAHMPSGILFTEKLLASLKSMKRPELVYSVHQSDIQVMTSPVYSIYFKNKMKNAYKNCDKILARAPHLAEKIVKILPEVRKKTEIQLSKIPQKYFVSDEEMFAKIKEFDGLTFVTVANLIKRKNIHLLLTALAQFKGKDFELKVIGDGKELKRLKKLTIRLKLSEKVKFVGKLSQDETVEEMKKSNVFILPSVNETLGLVYLEAIAAGCLCIGTKDTGIDGIIKNNINGFLCEPTVDGISKVLTKTFSLTSEDFRNLLANRMINL